MCKGEGKNLFFFDRVSTMLHLKIASETPVLLQMVLITMLYYKGQMSNSQVSLFPIYIDMFVVMN